MYDVYYWTRQRQHKIVFFFTFVSYDGNVKKKILKTERASPHKMVNSALSPIELKLTQNVSIDVNSP